MQRKYRFATLAAVALVVVVALYLLLWPNQPPSADFVTKPSAARSLQVVLDASNSVDPDGEVREYAWNFGDGQTGTGQSTQHIYQEAGEFIVTLTVTDNRGGTGSVSEEVVAYEHLHKLPIPEQWDSISKSTASHPPLFTEIEPADGVVVRGTEAWVRWSSGDEAEGRVLWHKAGEDEVRVNAATGIDPLLARLQPLEFGEKYEYVVEQISGDFAQRSNLRSFTVEGGVVFDPPVMEKTVQRDYDQSITLKLRNSTEVAVKVAAKALKQFDNLPADIVGPGSVDEPIELAPAEEVALRLAVFAQDATRITYEIPVQAAGVVGTARVHITKPKFDLDFRIVEENPHTLAKTIEVINKGQSLSDLTVRAAPPNEGEVRLEPTVGHARLGAGQTLQIIAAPVLYLEFEQLNAELEISAAGQNKRFPLEFEAPKGERLIAVRSQSQIRKGGQTHRCTNRGSSCDEITGTPDYGPYIPAADIMSDSARGPNDSGPYELALLDSNNNVLLEENSVLSTLSDRPVTFVSRPQPRLNTAPLDHVGRVALQAEIDSMISRGAIATGAGPRRSAVTKNSATSRSVLATLFSSASHLLSDLESIHGTTIIAQRASPTAPEAFNGSSVSSQSSGDPAVGGQRDELFEPESLGIDWSACKEWPNPAACDDRPCSNSQQWDCYVTAMQLREDYARTQQAASGNINYVPAHQLLDWERYRDIYAAELRDIEEKYMDLMRICCQECGIPLPSVETLQTTIPEVKGAMGVIASELQQFSAEAPQDRFPLNLGRVGCEFFFEEGGGVETPGPVAVGLPRRFVCNSFAPLDFIKGYSGLAGDFVEAWVKDDPPSPLYKQVVQPVVEPSVVPSVAVEDNHLLRQAIEAQIWAVAYIKAFIASYERYQGAEQTRDIAAMLLQAEAMLDFAERALEARRKVTLEVYQWELALFRLLDSAMKGFQERGGIAQIIRKNRAEVSGGLTAEAQERFRAAGFTESEIQAAETWMRELNPSTLEKDIARFQARMVAAQRLQEDFTSRSPSLTWPEPPEAGSFFDLKRISRRLVWQAKAALKGVSRPQLDFAPAKLPSGLAKALLRRVSFSRTHRGPFAKPLEGRAYNSSDMAAGWHAGERVLFAWHQRANQVVFTAFDPRGETLINPQEVGTGRWPRLAANGQRTAVAFRGEEGFVVRLHDGENWSELVPLDGGDAVIAFAPGGPLYAATSTGLWKMTDGSFEQVRKASYGQPALAVDGNGTPHVAWRRDGRIIYEGEELSEGERPTIVVTPQGAVHLAYLSDGSVVFRSYEGGEWSQPKEIVAKEKNPSWPTLAFGEGDDVRLTYIGDAKHGPPALWLVRLPDEEPILIPSLAGNVTDAWLMLKFSLNDARTRYRRHDMLVTVNDVWIKLFENTVPEGRYLFRLNPWQIFYSPRRPVPNRIAILNWGMNNGSYLITSDYEMIVRTAWSEYFGFASSPEEVINAAQKSWRITHDQPDLVVLANNLDLPVEAPIGSVDFPITVANLGEADAQPARLIMLSGDDQLATADIPLLKPEEQMIINIRLNGQLEKVRFEIEQDIRDFDPDNDVLDLALWNKEDYETVREQTPDLPPLPTEPEVTLVPTPNDVQPPWVAGSLPEGAKVVGEWSWERTPRFNAPRSHTSGEVEGRSLHYFIRADETLPLAAEDNLVQYVYLDLQAPPKQILLQLFVEGRKEGQAVYWGGAEDLIRVGGEVAKRLGDLPETGKWVRLRVPVETFGMKNAWINGLLFGQYGGVAHWGPTAKSISRLDRTEEVMTVSER